MQDMHEVICSIVKNAVYYPKVHEKTSVTGIIWKNHKYKTFLELGLASSEFNVSKHVAPYVEKVVGVDINTVRLKIPNFEMYTGTTDDFFKSNIEKFDIIFIDASHEIEQVKRDFYNSLNVLNKGGLIFMHDVDPITENFASKGSCFTAYKIIKEIESNDSLNVVVLPIGPAGLGIVQKKSNIRFKKWANNE